MESLYMRLSQNRCTLILEILAVNQHAVTDPDVCSYCIAARQSVR